MTNKHQKKQNTAKPKTVSPKNQAKQPQTKSRPVAPVFLQQAVIQPEYARPQDILKLQRSYGNLAALSLHESLNRQNRNLPIQRQRGRKKIIAPQNTSLLVIQAKLMTAAELQKQSGISRRGFFSRVFSGDSYDALIAFLKEYEKTVAKDKDGKEINKRLAILTDIDNATVKATTEYTNKAIKSQGKKKKNEREEKAESQVNFLYDLQSQVREERESILNLKTKETMEKTGQITGTGKAEKLKTTAELEAEGLLQKQAATFGAKAKSFFTHAFAVDFNPQSVASLSGKFLGVEEMLDIIKMVEKALEMEQKILAQQKEPKDPLQAMALAFAYLPDQLKPKTADPEERIVIKTKVQLLKEAKDLRMSGYAEHEKKTEMGTFKYTKSKIGKEDIKKGISGGIDQVAGQAESKENKLTGIQEYKKGDRNDFYMSGGQKDLLKDKYSGKEGDKQLTKDVGEAKIISGITGFVKNFKDLLVGIAEIKDIIKEMSGEDPVKKAKAKGDFAVKIVELISAGTGLAKSIGTALEGWAVGVGKMVPILGVVAEFLGVVQSTVSGILKWMRVSQEGKVLKEAQEQKSGLAGAIGSFKDRNTTLLLRAGADIIINSIKTVAEILKAIPGANLAGLIMGTVVSVVGGLKSVGVMLQESYRAGLRQETERKAEAGGTGMAKKVLTDSAQYAVTAIILEAKDGNPLAIKELAIYGVNEEDIREKSVAELRQTMFEELEELEDPTTVSQKIVGVFGRVV